MSTNRTGVILCGFKVFCLKKKNLNRMLASYELKAVLIYFISCLLNWAAVNLLNSEQTQNSLLFFLFLKTKDNSSAFPAQSVMLVLLEKWFSINTSCGSKVLYLPCKPHTSERMRSGSNLSHTGSIRGGVQPASACQATRRGWAGCER